MSALGLGAAASESLGLGIAVWPARGGVLLLGSVESKAKRWTGLEKALQGQNLRTIGIKSLAKCHSNEFVGRNAPGWYRERVLPKLAFEALEYIYQSPQEA